MKFCWVVLLFTCSLSSAQNIKPSNTQTLNLSSDQPSVLNFKGEKQGKLLIAKQNDYIYGEIITDQGSQFTTTWLGIDGYLLAYIAPHTETQLIFSTYLDTIDQASIEFKTFALEHDSKLHAALINIQNANNLRYLYFSEKTDYNLQAASLYQQAAEYFLNANQTFLRAVTLTELAFTFKDMEENLLALDVFAQSADSWQTSNKPFLEAKTQNQMGLMLWRLHRLEEALLVFHRLNQSLTSETILDTKSKLFHANILNNLGLIYSEKRETQKSIDFLLQKLTKLDLDKTSVFDSGTLKKTLKNSRNATEILITMHNLALAYDTLGSPLQAEQLWRMILSIEENKLYKDTQFHAQTLLATLLIDKGQLDQAKQLLEKSVVFFKNTHSNRWLYISKYHLAHAYQLLGLHELAKITFERTLSLRNPKDHPKDVIEIKLKLIEVYQELGEVQKLEQLKSETMTLAKQINHSKALALLKYSESLNNFKQENLTHSMEQINQAITLLSNNDIPRLLSKLYIHKAKILIQQKKSSQAIDLLTDVRKTLEEVWEIQLLNDTNNLLAEAYLSIGENDKAGKVINQEFKNIHFYINSSDNHKIRLQLSGMLEETLSIYNRYAFLSQQPKSAFFTTNKMLEKFNRLNNNKHNNQQSIKTKNLFYRIQAKAEALEQADLSKTDRSHIQQEIILLKSELDFSFSATNQIIEPEINLKTLQQSLDNQTLLIQYSVSINNSMSWWVSRNGFKAIPLAASHEIHELINSSRKYLSGKSRNKLSLETLSQSLIGHLKNYPHIKRIKLILDEPLNLIPFSALIDPRTNESLISTSNIQRVTGLKALTAPIVKYDEPNVIVFADAVTSSKDIRLKINSNIVDKSIYYPRLLGTKIEAENITQHFDTKILSGFDANKFRFINADLQNFNVIHIASHAFFHPEYPALSALVLSGFNQDGTAQPAFLRALEVSQIPMPVHLVVLSGCETGVENLVNAMGLNGLTDSFIQAGAENLIASLWQVDDRSTQRIMTAFYQNMSDGKTIADSLQQAQITVMKDRSTRHPKFWAGWFLSSNTHEELQ